MTKYVISSVEDVVIAADANTKNSRYTVLHYVPRNKFTTRAKARRFKSTRKNPTHWAIINTVDNVVVR